MPVITYSCPNCGGGLIFDPKTQQYKCEYCLSLFSQEQLDALVPSAAQDGIGKPEPGGEHEISGQSGSGGGHGLSGRPEPGGEYGAKDMPPVVYSCPSCGAEIVTDETTAATFCYYCHNPVILSGRLEGNLRPDCVVPFSIDRKRAEEIFGEWIRGKRYVPKDFYSPEQIKTMTGVYFPYWIYQCRVEGRMTAKGTKLRSWTAGNLRYTEKKVYQIERSGQVKIRNVARNALKKANSRLSEGVLPFSLSDARPFSTACLSGFMAEKRDRLSQEFEIEVRQEVQDFAVNCMKDSAKGYAGLSVSGQQTDIREPVWNYGLFPVWTLTYKGPKDGKIYYFALNGQTGKVCGELPVDGGKLFLLFLSVFFPLCMVLLGAGYLLPL